MAGYYQDPTGLYHLQADYYDADIGRFTQPDPSGQEQNPYLYAEGDPVNHIDPNGLIAWAKYGEKCLKGGAQSTVVGLYTGVSETGVGAGRRLCLRLRGRRGSRSAQRLRRRGRIRCLRRHRHSAEGKRLPGRSKVVLLTDT
ncbi:RHS repeat-associated core domain-containing protein [Streptomyces seoulensis]